MTARDVIAAEIELISGSFVLTDRVLQRLTVSGFQIVKVCKKDPQPFTFDELTQAEQEKRG